MAAMKAVAARYENGLLRLESPLALRAGEEVSLIVLRHSDSSRWDLVRLANGGDAEDRALSEQGLDDWAAALEAEDRR